MKPAPTFTAAMVFGFAATLVAVCVLIAVPAWFLCRPRENRGYQGRMPLLLSCFLSIIFIAVSRCDVSAEAPVTKSWGLTNGIRLVSVYLPSSTNVSIFTYLPLGLVT